MSSVSFHSKEKTAQIGGRERAYFNVFIDNLFNGVLDLPGLFMFAKPEEIERVVPIIGAWNGKILSMHRQAIELDDETFNLFETALNTALFVGNDAVKFMARVHAQCEIHGYVDGPNRAWLAGIIDDGLESGVLRKETQGYGKGLEDVSELLRERDDGPVVMSYSVCESFPPFITDEESEDFDTQLSFDDGFQWLLEHGGKGIEMKPDDWSSMRFGEGTTALDLKAKIETLLK